MRNALALVAALITLQIAQTTQAADLQVPEWLSGRAVIDQYEPIGPGSRTETLQSGLTLFGTARPHFTETVSAKLSLRGSAFRRSLEKGNAAVLRGEVKEAWVERDSSGFRVQAGQIITAWGRSDAVNPTDFLTSKDYTYLSSYDELRRGGAPGIRATFTPNQGVSPLEFTLAWNARYPQSKLLLPATAIPAGLTVETDQATPRLMGDRQEFALKAAYLASGWDASLSAFQGRTHLGQFLWDGSKVVLDYQKVRALGGDFSITFDEFVLRGESAYFFYDVGRSGYADKSITEPNHWDSVLGVERALGPRFRVIAQLLYRLHPSLKDSQTYNGTNPVETAVVRGLGRANALIQNYQDRSRLGGTGLLAYTSEDEKWAGEFAVIGNFIGGDYVLRPKMSRKFTDSLRAGAGVEYYGGPRDRPLGALRDYGNAYVEGTMTF